MRNLQETVHNHAPSIHKGIELSSDSGCLLVGSWLFCIQHLQCSDGYSVCLEVVWNFERRAFYISSFFFDPDVRAIAQGVTDIRHEDAFRKFTPDETQTVNTYQSSRHSLNPRPYFLSLWRARRRTYVFFALPCLLHLLMKCKEMEKAPYSWEQRIRPMCKFQNPPSSAPTRTFSGNFPH